MAATLTELLQITNCSRVDFFNWKRQDFLSRNPKSTAGVAQKFARAAALEFAFFAALRHAGIDPHAAAREVARWLREESSGRLAPIWVYNPTRDQFPGSPPGQGIGIDGRPVATLFRETQYLDRDPGGWGMPDEKDLQAEATSLILVNRREIVARVDALFGASGRK